MLEGQLELSQQQARHQASRNALGTAPRSPGHGCLLPSACHLVLLLVPSSSSDVGLGKGLSGLEHVATELFSDVPRGKQQAEMWIWVPEAVWEMKVQALPACTPFVCLV